MTGPQSETESPGTRPISVAELLARNGTIGAPAVTRRRRRRRGDSDAVTVAELTGEIPIIRDDVARRDRACRPTDRSRLPSPRSTAPARTAAVDDAASRTSQPKTSPSHRVLVGARAALAQVATAAAPQPGPSAALTRGPPRRPDADNAEQPAPTSRSESQSGAEHMSPDPLEQYADIPVDVMDSDVREAELESEDSAYVRSYLQASDSTLFGGQTLADEVARRRGDERAASGCRSADCRS